MNLTILGGILKGLSWPFPEYRDLRPTSVMLRRRVFDKFQNLHDHKFIDLCSGTGLMGLEAFSRGCYEVILVEKDRKKIQQLQHLIQNSPALRNIASWPQLIASDFHQWLIHKYQDSPSFFQNALIYFDPPYEENDFYHKFNQFLFTCLEKTPDFLRHSFVLIEYDILKNKLAQDWTFKEFEIFKASISFIKQGQSTLAILKF